MLKVERYQQRLEGLKFKVTYQSLLEGVNEVNDLHLKPGENCVLSLHYCLLTFILRLVTSPIGHLVHYGRIQGLEECQALQGVAEPDSDARKLHERCKPQRRSLWFQDCQY